MIKTKNLLTSLNLEIPALEVDQEGKLRGGFCAFSADPDAIDAPNQDCNCNCRCPKKKNKKGNKKDNCNPNCRCPEKKHNSDCNCACADFGVSTLL